MADGVIRRIHNGRDVASARTQYVLVETKPKRKLPKQKRKPPQQPETGVEVGLFVSGGYRWDTDGETLIIVLSRKMSPEEQTIIKNAIKNDCKFVRLTHIRGATVRLRLRANSGEPLCERQVHECVIRVVKHL